MLKSQDGQNAIQFYISSCVVIINFSQKFIQVKPSFNFFYFELLTALQDEII